MASPQNVVRAVISDLAAYLVPLATAGEGGTTTGVVTLNSAVITGVANPALAVLNSTVTDADGLFPVGTVVESVFGSAVTVSNVATGNSTGAELITFSLSSAQFSSWLASYVALHQDDTMPLSSVSIDFEHIKLQLQNMLAAQPLWTELITAGGGETLLEMIAAGITLNQVAVIRAARETMPDTARVPSSIYAITRLLGVSISRKTPSAVPVILTAPPSTSTLSIPAPTQFLINGLFYFNRTTIIFQPGVTQQLVTLYQGQLLTTNFISDGTAFQSYNIGNNDFTVSQQDVFVTVAGTIWNPTQQIGFLTLGLWENLPTDQVFVLSTLPNGNAQIAFGNGIYGEAPSVGATISVVYAQTMGTGGNIDLTNQTIQVLGFPTVLGIAQGPSLDGTDQLDANFYKKMGPGTLAAKFRAVTRADHVNLSLNYPGVIDALFRGQKELAPLDARYAMVSQAVILTNPAWTTTQINAFLLFLNGSSGNNGIGIQNMNYLFLAPTAVPINVNVSVFCFATADLNAVESQITSAIINLFALQEGSLGRSIYRSDISSAVDEATEEPTDQVDYLIINQPVADTMLSSTQYAVLGTLTINMNFSTRAP